MLKSSGEYERMCAQIVEEEWWVEFEGYMVEIFFFLSQNGLRKERKVWERVIRHICFALKD